MSSLGNVILIEDDQQIRQFVKAALESAHWKVFEAENGKRGLIEARSRKPDLLVLDLGLPDMDGLEIVKEFRKWSTIPILILSARIEEQQKILALDAGADDYLTKPFGVGELLARVRAVTRRRLQSTEVSPKICFADIEVDFTGHSVTRSGTPIHLTSIEYRLLSALLSNMGKIMSHRRLMQEVWGPNHTESAHYLRIYMSRLRQKLELDPAQPTHLLTETGIGYRFEL